MNSKFLSLILRHKPETVGLKLDDNGWVSVADLLNATNTHLDRLEEIVRDDNKRRFSFSPCGTKIRANQGHSIDITLDLVPQVPPETLYHGTAIKNLESIRKSGIIKGSRNHVHLSQDIQTAIMVGKRHGTPLVLSIAALDMHSAGYIFWLSDNNVWLTDYVPVEFIYEP